MRKSISRGLVLTVAAGLLAGCQTPQQSSVSAAMTCDQAGLRPGSRRFERCHDAVYAQNRAQSDQAATTAAVVGAAALAGGAIAGAAASRPYYYGPYYGPAYYRPYPRYWW